MDRINSTKKALDDALHQKNCFNDFLEKAESKTNIDRLYLVLGAAFVVLLYLIFGYGTSFLANVIGFIYPAYKSIKALETLDKDDDTKWLTYWVVFSLFSVVESFTDIFFYWIPLYSLLKCSFFVFMMIPTKPNGSVIIYQKIIRPYFLAHEKTIDNAMNQAADLAGDFTAEAKKKAVDIMANEFALKTD